MYKVCGCTLPYDQCCGKQQTSIAYTYIPPKPNPELDIAIKKAEELLAQLKRLRFVHDGT